MSADQNPQNPTTIPDAVVEAACAAYLSDVEGLPQQDAARLWHDWRLKPAAQGDKAAIEALAEDRSAMRAALVAALRELANHD